MLGEIPPLLRDIVRRAVVAQPDMVLVEPRPRRPARPAADLMIVALPADEEEGACSRYLYADPTLKVLAIGVRDGRGALYELTPRRASLGELSADGLVQAIRACIGGAR